MDTRNGRVTSTPWRYPQLRLKPSMALEDQHGALWLAGRPPALYRIDLQSGAIRGWSGRDADGPSDTAAIDAMIEVGDTLWTGATGQLQIRNLRTGQLLKTLTDDPLTGGNIDYKQVGLGPEGEPWVTSPGGMLRWDAASQQLLPVTALSGTRIFNFRFLPDGRLWLHRATGLELWKPQDGTWREQRRLGRDDGLPVLESYGMQIDSRGRLWLSSLRGLFRIDPEASAQARVRIFGTRDGLSTQEFVWQCLARVDRDVLAGGLMDGHTLLMDLRCRMHLRTRRCCGCRRSTWCVMASPSSCQLTSPSRYVQTTASCRRICA